MGGNLIIMSLVSVLVIDQLELVNGHRERKFSQKLYLFGDTDVEKKDIPWAQE